MFKLISSSTYLNTILDSFPEDLIIKKVDKKVLTYLEDKMQCLNNLLTRIVNGEKKDNNITNKYS